MELMPTGIGATNGTPGAHLEMDVPTLTMDLKPFLKLKIGTRYHSRFFDYLAHPNLSATLATDQK